MPHYITSRLRSLFLENTEYSIFDMRSVAEIDIKVWAASMTGRILTFEEDEDGSGVVQHIQSSPSETIRRINAPVLRFTESVRGIAGGALTKWGYRMFATFGIVEAAEQVRSTETAACNLDENCNTEVRGE